MATPSLKEQIMTELEHLTPVQQARLLEVALAMQQRTEPAGTPGETLLAHTDRFAFEPGEFDEMMHNIEEGCENVDWDGWQ